jgi:hypothetical protein
MMATLADEADVPPAELRAVIEGAEPAPELLRRLGPALDIRTADMFVVAGLDVPLDLASAYPTTLDVGWILGWTTEMDAHQVGRLDEFVRSLPVRPRTEPAPGDDYPDGPGAVLLRLLRNRNMNPNNAKNLLVIGGGPYVSAPTVALLGPGKTVLTPEYVTGFANLLGYPPDLMVAIAGVGPVFEKPGAHPACADIAALAWNARRLDDDQIRQAARVARELR